MATAGPNYPTAEQNAIDGSGTRDWTLSSSTFADDGSYATATFDSVSEQTTKYLDVSSFGFDEEDIPDDAINITFTVEIEHKADVFQTGGPTNYVYGSYLNLLRSGTPCVSSSSVSSIPTTSDATVTNAGAPSAFGETWTPAQARGVGVRLSYTNSSDDAIGNQVYVDFIRVTVHYDTATAPTAPQSPSATADSNSINLAWSAPSSDGGSAITAYKVYRGTSSGNLSLYQTLGVVTSYDDTSVTPGTRYYYAIVATNAIGDSSQSSEVNALVATGYKNILMLGVG